LAPPALTTARMVRCSESTGCFAATQQRTYSINREMAKEQSPSLSDQYPLDFIEGEFVAPAVVQLRGARIGMVRHWAFSTEPPLER
jgi:hypothetical protein